MTRLTWGTPGERFYESGVDQGVLYVDDAGVSWNGLISVSEKSSGGTPTPYYLDGYKYTQLLSTEEFEATLEAYSSPLEFGQCDGSMELYAGLFVTQQRRKPFALSYRTLVGNDTDGLERGYKIHIVYNATAGPSERKNASVAELATPQSRSWSITTIPEELSGIRPTSHFVVDSTRTSSSVLSDLEDLLYGTNTTDASLPSPSELVAMFA
jgi:hypothetical protein